MPPFPSVLRVALVCLHTSPGDEPGAGDAGGMNVVVLKQGEAMASLGHEVEIVTRRSSPEQPDEQRLGEGLTLRFLDAGPPEPMPKGVHEAYIDEFRARLDACGPYDIVHSHHWFSGMAALPYARLHGVPHVQSFHSIAAHESTPLSSGERPESAGRMAGEAWLAQESDAVVTASEAEADTVVQRLGGTADRVSVVLPGVDGELFHPAEETPGNSGRYALVAGRLQPLKGFDLAIRAIAAVPPAVRPELLIAGDVSADYAGYVDELRAIATEHGIDGGVRFLGPRARQDLAGLLREASIVLVPSHSETYGLVALEAAASGVPVVAAASGGLQEAVVDGRTGVVLGSRDPEVWGEAIRRILADPEVARELASAGREHALQLDWTRSARRLLAVYDTVLGADREREEAFDSDGSPDPRARALNGCGRA
ncbi:glycosyltransferase [Planctomonas psychrotolerans]|uniref:glycosyltransferase n=1 Tax=Planctomonas psychrotolerans TaxID=2528712 RepID=UPI00123AA9B5|nr:glycosyltransferase [Planctomonas psychrotolerans]